MYRLWPVLWLLASICFEFRIFPRLLFWMELVLQSIQKIMQSTIIKIDGIGPVRFERSRRARHLNISVRPKAVVRVAVPLRVSLEIAEKFVRSKEGWVKKQLTKIKQLEVEHRSRFGTLTPLKPNEAREKLEQRIESLARQHGFIYNKVSIRNQKTRWGSCSVRNNISLNMKLVLLPDELIDYVILHELVHTRIKSHSRQFWTELNRYVLDAKKTAAKLREISMAFL